MSDFTREEQERINRYVEQCGYRLTDGKVKDLLIGEVSYPVSYNQDEDKDLLHTPITSNNG